MVCKKDAGPGEASARERSAAAWRLARQQHRAISRSQLLALGFSRRSIQHRLATGRLWPLARGVYSVGPPRGTDEQRWSAALLACCLDGLKVRSRPSLSAADVVKRDGIPVTSIVPVEQTKAWVNDFEVDFHWPSLGLVVETDGLKYHRTPSSQLRDRLRDQTHSAAGLTQLRFTHWQVAHEADHVRSILARTVGRLR